MGAHHDSPELSSPNDVDLTSCEREPIHVPGAIQPHGFLLACSLPEWAVAHVSANAAIHLPALDPETLIGMTLDCLWPRETVHTLRNSLQTSMMSGSAERLPRIDLGSGQGLYDLTIHVVGDLAIVEGVSCALTDLAVLDPVTLVKGMIGRLKRAPNLDGFLKLAAQQMRAVTGYDRVMIYKFLEDGSGQVVAEAVRSGVEPYLGLRYPASDIPAQARALYKRQWLRLIPDTAYEPSQLVPDRRHDGGPVDLSLASLRSVSPIHIEYLHNMGVRASMTVSLMQGDELWGLIACHHQAPHHVSASLCAAAELFGQILSIQIETKEQQEELSFVARAHAAHDRLLAAMSPEETIFDNLTLFADTLNEIIACDGIGVWNDERFTGFGVTPPEEAIPSLIQFLSLGNSRQPFVTSELSRNLPAAQAYAANVSGLIAIPFSRTPRDYLLLFRRELVQTVTWGGDPTKPATPSPDGVRLSPRKSFAAWQETVRGRSAPWRPAERQIAEALRVSLLEVILRRSDLIERERRAAQESQTLLIAELNHRVKNILALIRALVRQSGQGADSVERFTAELENRIRALAHAHDQFHQIGWSAAPMVRLLEAEAQAWTLGREDRIAFEGPPVMLDVRAYQALALVVHEMMTNAAKYGALSSELGRLHVGWTLTGEGALRIEWRESGGPVVQAPQRRGFGSIVIERTIPFELRGEAAVAYQFEGVHAQFLIPAAHVSEDRTVHKVPRPASVAPPAPLSLHGRSLLLVEDSMMIALDAQAMLQKAGAEVEVVGTVAAALRLLAVQLFDMAVLDINLSGETSFRIADELVSAKRPFLFATGYLESVAIPERFRTAPLLTKPYDENALAQAMGKLAPASM
ncbi:HWE histidine kinase domain-containing protein [Azospirillum sp. SYSU D00513]|uniref:HWE histidine kinase domain-containing protein n=1 Tax=Azospirillum sp. SYSU D00513 TaxID=2812561 RepID=UPI001A97407A